MIERRSRTARSVCGRRSGVAGAALSGGVSLGPVVRGLAGVVLLLALCSLIPTSSAIGTQSVQVTSSGVIFLQDGPNDGEPLGGWMPFHLRTPYSGSGYLLVMEENRLIESVPIFGGIPNGSLRSLIYRLDTSQLLNGSRTISFHLLGNRQGLIGTVTVTAIVDNPTVTYGAVRTGGASSEIFVSGRRGDTHFVLIAGRAPMDTSGAWRSPQDFLAARPGPRVVAQGAYPPLRSLDERPRAKIVTNFDNLFRLHGPSIELVLWSFSPHRGWVSSTTYALEAAAEQIGDLRDGDGERSAGDGPPNPNLFDSYQLAAK